MVCQGLQPGAFGYGHSRRRAHWAQLDGALYCSVAVLSSVGLSDIMPVTPMARALVMLESFTGIMYIAFVVSRLISLTVTARREHRNP